MSEDEKITLDKKAFKVLASDTRVNILKSLGQQRKMLTELAKELGMSVSTIKEHLDKLSEAGLVVQRDDGHKWKYYELTRVGETILNPDHDTKIWVLLSLSGVALLATAYDFINRFMTGGMSAFSQTADSLTKEAAERVVENLTGGGAAASPAIDTGVGLITSVSTPILHILGLVIFTALIGVSIGYLWKRKKN
ncbi:MAG: metalloregulator ArsR/SmtB family transcription factor [Nanoarchaeota archaeon]|nr:metalloregulator ArsR/SmtB family transcription factor [Nanoarchaeota archaeon]MBU1135436.1 metalloregulator ArsR/SmtB family transcription factor [Nanoarchaeota archaeon]MBU2519678.1 metalloregulator ArsR/SmtB family transcription factor [Nanoarchaeota archaeon]